MNLCKRDGHEWERLGVYSKCKRCGKTKRNTSPVKVIRPIKETGEIVEQTLPAGHFKPKRPECLTREFERKILACERPGLVYPGDEDPPVEPGQVIQIGSNIELEILRIRKTKGGDRRAIYTVHDFRPTLIRRTPPMYEPPETDAEGYPLAHDEEAIKAASIDGNYTQDPAQAVPESASEVDVEFRRLLSVKKRTKEAETKREEQPMTEAEEDARRAAKELRQLVERAVKKGLDPVAVLAPINRAISEAHAGVTEQPAPDHDEVAA
ncbi:MAG TPA: hypothetical protein VFI17_08540 [Solirubrobacterales bacterium]|nr:hypothetical protein [Solirubrobacterales bacterium]